MVDYVRQIPLYTLEGVRDADITTHYFSTEDKIGLSMLRYEREPSEDAVLILHGLTTSSDMYIMPEQEKNLVTYLLDSGYTDVWTLDWRGSLRHNYDLYPTRFTIDDVALYDHPAAVRYIRSVIGQGKRLHVICHCVGSISFIMSLFAGLIDDVSCVVSNSVSLTPHVPGWSRFKITLAPFLVSWILRFPALNPRWSYLPGPGIPQGKPLSKVVSLFHPECNVPSCHMVSFMWGTGHPACYMHENMLDISHERVGDLFGSINMSYYRHIRKMIQAGAAVKYLPKDPRYAALPDNYLDNAARVKTPILFITGDHNRVFKDSNIITYNTLKELQKEDRNELRILPGYGHQDPFMGKNNHVDVFPHLVDYLNRHRNGTTASAGAAGASTSSTSTPSKGITDMSENNDAVGITFKETMRGPFALGQTDPKEGKTAGRKEGYEMAMHASIDIDDIDKFISDPDHDAKLTGSLDYTPWGDDIPAPSGVFNLFKPTDNPELKLMVYELAFQHDGKDYYLAGQKDVRDDPIFDLWKQTTTLYTKLYEGKDKSGPVVGAGVLSLGVIDLIKLVSTLHATNADGVEEKAAAVGKFGKFFMGELWDSYVKHAPTGG